MEIRWHYHSAQSLLVVTINKHSTVNKFVIILFDENIEFSTARNMHRLTAHDRFYTLTKTEISTNEDAIRRENSCLQLIINNPGTMRSDVLQIIKSMLYIFFWVCVIHCKKSLQCFVCMLCINTWKEYHVRNRMNVGIIVGIIMLRWIARCSECVGLCLDVFTMIPTQQACKTLVNIIWKRCMCKKKFYFSLFWFLIQFNLIESIPNCKEIS